MAWNKDFNGLLSGALTATYNVGEQPRWTCKGAITIDKAHMKSAVFTSNAKKGMLADSALAKNVALDIHVSTKSPVAVKTFFFTTNAQIDASVKGTVAKPQLAGSVDISKGSFIFPYKPMHVTLGKLHLPPGQTDPGVQIIAKNTIKRYAITLTVTGTLKHPKIQFDSVPALPQEKIVSLLLTGSEEGPWSLDMAAPLLMQVESLLFGSAEASSRAQEFFKTLFKPFKNIRFVPSREDGGTLQGTLEVDLTDNLRAKAQNDLTLSRDTKVELEYSLSDDMVVKAVRDGSGSLGGELEMRWKF